jgi:hypothetical protein
MSQSTTVTSQSPEDEVLGQLLLALEEATNRDEVIADFIARFPRAEERIRSLAGGEWILRQVTSALPQA